MSVYGLPDAARAWIGMVKDLASGCGPNCVERATLCRHWPRAVEARALHYQVK